MATTTKPTAPKKAAPAAAAPVAHPASAAHTAPTAHAAPAAHAVPTAHSAPAAHAVPTAAHAAPAAAKKKKAPAAKKQGVAVERGKRKESVARATIRKGKGVVRINSMNLKALNNKFVEGIISDALRIAPEITAAVDIDVEVYGGGQIGQAQACRTAIAKAIVSYSKDDELKAKVISTDRSLLVEDSRRVEPKKYKGPKARARFQKSYR